MEDALCSAGTVAGRRAKYEQWNDVCMCVWSVHVVLSQ